MSADHLPPNFSMENLERNLATLSKRQPKMVQRISWPVDGSHVLFGEDETVLYRVGSSGYPLSLSEEMAASGLSGVNGRKDVLVFGIGLGEQVEYLLDRFPDKTITAWEKDPWLLRLFLMRGDYSRYLSSGALRIALGADIVDLVPQPSPAALVCHPLLRGIYHNECGLLVSGIGEKRVIMNTGGLFVDDVASAFRQIGYTPFYLDLGRISLEEIEYSIVHLMPRILFSINYPNGLAELATRFDMTLICWEIDHVVDTLPPLQEVNDRSFVFTYRKRNVAEFTRAGFPHVEFLPMATDTDVRKPVPLSGEELKTYSAPVSFVGNILSAQARNYRRTLFDFFPEYCRAKSIPMDPEADPFEEILRRQAMDYTEYSLPKHFHDRLPGFAEFFMRKTGTSIDPVKLLAEGAAAEKRLLYIGRLGRVGVKVWGDEGWKRVHGNGVQYMGPAGHKIELNKIYSGASVNIEVNRLYQPDMVNMRVFDIMACGGFVLAEYTDDLADLFDLGSEIVTYRTLDELEQTVEHYLARPQEARRVAERGMAAVRERHTVRRRVETMISRAEGTGAFPRVSA